MKLEDKITSLTARHIGRCLSQLNEAGVPEVCIAAVKREFWFLSDDVKLEISKNEEQVNDIQPNPSE